MKHHQKYAHYFAWYIQIKIKEKKMVTKKKHAQHNSIGSSGKKNVPSMIDARERDGIHFTTAEQSYVLHVYFIEPYCRNILICTPNRIEYKLKSTENKIALIISLKVDLFLHLVRFSCFCAFRRFLSLFVRFLVLVVSFSFVQFGFSYHFLFVDRPYIFAHLHTHTYRLYHLDVFISIILFCTLSR